jgi:non-ribosomal peptide synthetase component F
LFSNWSPDGTKLSIGCYQDGGLWIYDMQTKEATKVLDGAYSWCAWSDPAGRRLAIEKVYAQWHHEIWVTDRPLAQAPAAAPAQGTSEPAAPPGTDPNMERKEITSPRRSPR